MEGKRHVLPKPQELLLLAVCIACKAASVTGSLGSFVRVKHSLQ